MDNSSWMTICVSVIATYAVHSTLLLTIAWLAERFHLMTSEVVREHVWKWAAVGPFLTVVLQIQMTGATALWQWEFNAGDAAADQAVEDIEPQLESVLRRENVADIEGPAVKEIGDSSSLPAVDFIGESSSETLIVVPSESAQISTEEAKEDAQWQVEIIPAQSSPGGERSVDVVPEKRERQTIATVTEVSSKDFSGESSFDHAEVVEFEESGAGGGIESPAIGWAIFVTTFVGIFIVFGLLRLIVLAIRIRWHLRHGKTLENSEAHSVLKQICQRRGIDSTIFLLVSDRVSEPCAVGVFRWGIVLPAGLESKLNSAELAALLSHEVAHLIRRDPVWLWAGRVLTHVLPWQPLNFLAVKRWQQAAELQCDEWATSEVQGVVLARVLTTVAEWKTVGNFQPGLPVTAPPLSVRVERLLDDQRKPDRWNVAGRRRLLLVSLTVALLSVSVFGPRFVWAETNAAHSSEFPVTDSLNLSADESQFNAIDPHVAADIVSLQQEFSALAADLELAMQLLSEQEADPEVTQKTEVIINRLEQIRRSIKAFE